MLTKNQRKKQTMIQLVTGRLLEKYKLKRKIAHAIGFSQKRWVQRQPGEGFIRRRKLSSGCKIVKDYLVRVDVSRMTTGKNNTITRRKRKRQRRLIADSLKIFIQNSGRSSAMSFHMPASADCDHSGSCFLQNKIDKHACVRNTTILT